jgi:hypothetical protein
MRAPSDFVFLANHGVGVLEPINPIHTERMHTMRQKGESMTPL